jgi:hypothetical protein
MTIGGAKTALTIGGSMNSRSRSRADDLFAGDLDELLIYDRALSEEELRALAARPSSL